MWPTLEEFKRNQRSIRHAYLASVAVYHCIDRVARTRGVKPAVVRQEWARKSREFRLTDIVAHDFKHVRSTNRTGVIRPAVPLRPALFGSFAFNTIPFNDTGEDAALRHLLYTFYHALHFIRREAGGTSY